MNINEIINSEIKNIVSEGYALTDDKFNFNQRISNSTFYNYQSFTTEYDTEISESDILINWKLNFWLNQSGIENLFIDIIKVSGTYTLQLYNKQTDKLEQETTKNIEEVDWKFVVDEATISKGGTLYVSGIDFNFDKKICEINFN